MEASDFLTDHLPQIGRMLAALEAEQYETLFDDFQELDDTFGQLYGTYVDELQYLAADEPQNEVAERIGEQFVELRPLINALRDDLSLEELDAACETLEALKEEAGLLYSLFIEYRDVAMQGPRYSQIPYTHELIRVCKHYLDGKLSVEAVLGRFEVFCQYHEALENQMSTLVPSPPERQAFEDRVEDIEEALTMQLQAIEDMDHALEANEEDVLKECLEILAEAAEVLVETYQDLQQADLQPVTVSCIRCSAPNSPDARMCGKCGAVIPQSVANQGPSSTMAFEEDGSAVGPKEAEEIRKLQKAVDTLLHTGDEHPLAECLENYYRKMDRIKKQFGKMDNPPTDIPAEHRVLLQRSRDIFVDALAILEDGLETLSQGLRSQDPITLEDGMTLMASGSELFRQFQVEFNQAQDLTNT